MITNLAPMSEEAMEYRTGIRLIIDHSSSPLIQGITYPVADPEDNQFGVLFRVQDDETFIVDFEPATGK